MRKILTGSLVILLLSSCSKHSPPPSSNSQPVADLPAIDKKVNPEPQASPSVTIPEKEKPEQKKIQETETVSRAQQQAIDDLMATHQHRLYHALWHSTRNALNFSGMKAIKKLSPEWGKHAKVCDSQGRSLKEDQIGAAGEEFLYMHRNMMRMLNEEFAKRGLPQIKAWKSIPDPSDSNWPVPDRIDANDFSKSDQVYGWMKSWEKAFRDPEFLKGKSLSWVGHILEFSLHNMMHQRWSGPVNQRTTESPLSENNGKKITVKGLLDPWPYDDAQFNWLALPYSAHVNPIFWKLHGFVDETIPAWLAANGYESIDVNCSGKEKCYQWQSTWEGAMPPDPVQLAAKKKNQQNTHHHGRSFASVKEEEEAVVAAQNLSGTEKKSVGDLLQKGSFRNSEFEEFMKNSQNNAAAQAPGTLAGAPRDQAPTQMGAAFQATGMYDPVSFVQQFRICR